MKIKQVGKKLLTLISLSFLCGIVFLNCQRNDAPRGAEGFKISKHGSLQGGLPYHITIHNITHPDEKPGDQHLFGSPNGTLPESRIAQIIFKLGEHQVPFPPESFEDLSNMTSEHTVTVAETGEDVLLILQGGSQASRYRAVFTIRPDRVASRSVTIAGGEPITTDYPTSYKLISCLAEIPREKANPPEITWTSGSISPEK